MKLVITSGMWNASIDINALNKDLIPKGIVDEKIIRKHHALPMFKRGNKLFVAVSDPTNLQALDEIKFQTRIMNLLGQSVKAQINL